jgi:hypothetical protein
MADLKDKKDVGAPFPNQKEYVRVVYDFAKDGGAIGDLTILKASEPIIVKMSHYHVLTAVDAVGAIEVSVGKGTSGTQFLNGVLKAALAINTVGAPTAAVRLAKDEIINLDIAESAATVGKVEFVFEVMKSN